LKVLTVGITGQFAALVVPELKKRGIAVRALIRDQRHAGIAFARGADETVLGNLENPGSLRNAAEGVDGIFHINPAFSPNEFDMGIAMLEAARAASVERFVFSGVIHPSILGLSNHAAKLPVEEVLYQSGMNFTVLQPAMFMQNFDRSWSDIVRRGRFALPYSVHARACYVDYRDVAEAAAIAFATNRLDYGTFELCAPGMLNRIEVAALMSEALDFPVKAGEISFDEWAHAAQLPSGPMRDGLRHLYEDYDRHGFPGGNALVLRAILEREPRTLRQYIQELAHSEEYQLLRAS
jgi:uncharacterized protein YbjT (DUF2867 family)